jgi:hypothetical protein
VAWLGIHKVKESVVDVLLLILNVWLPTVYHSLMVHRLICTLSLVLQYTLVTLCEALVPKMNGLSGLPTAQHI